MKVKEIKAALEGVDEELDILIWVPGHGAVTLESMGEANDFYVDLNAD